mmetsp:Transcript_14608/g.20877  ORF Transcript_14608/g.20877 Transcript_14608/m.20877 type:complete len:287 (-) Transcript_14608:1872-2732(-)
MAVNFTATSCAINKTFNRNRSSAIYWLTRRFIATDTNRSITIDKWQATTVKPASFYADHSAIGRRRKCYFYSIDLQGRVFLEDILPKNLATSLKDTKFLDVFFRNIRRIDSKDIHYLSSYDAKKDYPYVSPCGIEMNYIRPADTPIVFHLLKEICMVSTSNPNKSIIQQLCFAGSLTQEFSPTMLAISKRTGKIYHQLSSDQDFPITSLHKLQDHHQYGLLKSSLAISISENLVDGYNVEQADMRMEDSYSGMNYFCTKNKLNHPIQWLPSTAEPGSWSFSFQNEE